MTSRVGPAIRRRELGALLRQIRADHGLSADEVTDRLLFSPTKLSRIETGRAAPARAMYVICATSTA